MEDVHPLKKWMIRKGFKQSEFAREIGCSESYLSEILKGKKTVSLGLALKISKATDNAVSLNKIASRSPVGVEAVA